MINIILVGPCGVGKSTIGRELACCRKMIYLDFDKLGILDMNRRRGERSPFSVSNLNFSECLPSIIPKVNNNYFILDIGGGTVFRENVNNFDRVQQLQWVKNKYNPKIIVLYANKEILSQRFLATRSFSEDSLNIIWNNWKKISEPNWKKIGDFFIDTSHLTINSTVEKINEILDQVDLKK